MTDHPPVLDLSLNDGSSNLGYCCHYGQNAQDIGLDCSFSITAQPPPPFPVSIGGTDMSEKQEYQFQKATGISGHVNSAVSKQKSSINFSIDTSSQWQDSPQSIWSHKDIQEAFLMRYFVEELAQWFDSCDASRHFAVTIPHKAPNCPALLYAIFSASARHLSRSQQTKANDAVFSGKKLPYLGEDTALEYQSLCITHLIKLSGDSIEVQDEDLLAAAVILRFYEEVDAPLAGVDGETYLRGTQVFLSAQSASAIRAGGLQLAAFWVGIRQEFHTGFLKQRPFQLDLNCCSTSTFRLLDPADDCTWANRIILHCAETLTFCHGEDGQTIEKYKELLDYNQAWQILTPPTFNPIYSRQPDRAKGEVFPAIWYLDDCIVTAIQHWHLAKILLAVFDPNVPRMGPGRRALVARREAEIKDNVFRLCGIALSNRTAPALITACMGVSMCGDRVTDHSEQEALLGILVKTEKTHSLSTAKAQKDLQEAWGWTMPTKTLQIST